MIIRNIRSAGPKFAAVLALVLGGLLFGAGPALAHDGLEKTNPKDGATLKKLPEEIVLTFTANPLALGSVVRVQSPDGDVTEGKPEIVDNTVSQAIAPGAPAGKYNVQWRVTSSDGHPIDGEFSFTAEAGNVPVVPTETAEATPETTTEAAEPIPSATQAVSSETAAEDDGGTSPVLIITLIVLALLVIGAAVYLFVVAPRRSDES